MNQDNSKNGREGTFCLRVACPDQKGLIAAVTQAIAAEGGNILDLAQHTATDIDTFMLRAVFERGEKFDEARFRADFGENYAKRFQMEWSLFDLSRRQRMAIFVSKTDHCLFELLLQHRDGELECDVPCIISNHEDLRHVAGSFGVNYYVVPSDLPKEEQEARFNEILERERISLVVLARYMQILRKEFTDLWRGRIINIHHGFLPAFQGARPYQRAWEKGVKLIGATAHYASEDLDQGPIIAQDVARVDDACSVAEFIQMGKDVERRVLLHAVKLHLAHKVFVRGARTFVME